MKRRSQLQQESKYTLVELNPVKARVKQQLAEGQIIATPHHKAGNSGISGVWANFSLLVRTAPEDDEPVGFVQCNSCKGVLRYDSHRTGTSSLKRHRCMRGDDGMYTHARQVKADPELGCHVAKSSFF